MRLIDADALIEFVENRYDITWADDYEGGIKDACIDMLEKINSMPIINPERKKGKWIYSDRFQLQQGKGIAVEAMCSECELYSYTVNSLGYMNYDYCPRCGADMRGEQDD